MKRAILLSLIIYGLVLAGIATRQGRLLALAIPLVLYLALGLLYEPEVPRLSLKRTLSNDRANPNQPVTVTLILTNDGPALEELYISDIVPKGLQVIEGAPNLLITLQTGQTTTLTYIVGGQRGLYRFSAVYVAVRDYLGLFEKQMLLEAPDQFFVLPEIAKVRQIAIKPRRIGVYNGSIPARQGGPGVEFFGVREYQAGDPLRWINARASARYNQQLFINEFEQERMAEVGLILDARQQSDAQVGQTALFEYSIQAAATLAETFLSGGNRVGLFIYGRSLDWTLPGYGKVQLERILRVLARAEQGDGKIFENLDHLPTRLFPARSQLVLMSPLLKQDPETLVKLRAKGYQLMVISPDPIDFEQRNLKPSPLAALAARMARLERNLTLNQLAHAGVQVVDWPVEIPFHQIAHQALGRLPMHRR
jgi:uncharacterized repeat protein (TIGR01451 family)